MDADLDPTKSNGQLTDEDIPRFVRKCWQRYMEATEDERKAEKESRGFWVGGKFQWREGETENRQSKNRPWVSINRCKPAVDQVENEARNNPPGPQAHPVGGGADKDGADILEGLIREYEYRCNAQNSYIIGLRYAGAGGRGAFEMATEYAGERTMEQQIVIKPVDDPDLMFYDPEARMPCREDSMWGGKIRRLEREQLIEEYGLTPTVLNRSLLAQLSQSIGSWMADAFGWSHDWNTTATWTGGAAGRGPYYVCEFYMVRPQRAKLTMYSDSIMRFDDEPIPAGVTPQKDENGEIIGRTESRRKVFKYIVTALDVLKKTEWQGTTVPHFWIMGPEMRVDGKLFRLSLITNAMDAQRALNYTATSAAEIVGSMTKAPFIGFEGQFDVQNAQGFNPWDSSNTQMWQYMEVKPVFADDGDGHKHLLPAPIRNTWEAPIQNLMQLATFFGEQIKAATSVFFEPSLPSAAQAQSGSAIKALQQQTNTGTLNWQQQLRMAVELSYRQAAIIFPKILDGTRVKTIVRPDNQHEIITINQEFPVEEMDQETGKHRTKDGRLESLNSLNGQYALRATAGPNFQDRTEESIEKLTEVIKFAPQIFQNPGVLAQFVRMVGAGNPQVEAIADAISPAPDGDVTPQQMQAQLQQAASQNKELMGAVQQLQHALQAKLPQVEADKFKAMLDGLVKLRVAEINASKDQDKQQADLDASQLEHLTGMAHEAATQATQHEHEHSIADKQALVAAAAQQSDQQHATQSQDSDQQAAAEQAQSSGDGE